MSSTIMSYRYSLLRRLLQYQRNVNKRHLSVHPQCRRKLNRCFQNQTLFRHCVQNSWLRMTMTQKCRFSSSSDDMKNDAIMKEWLREITEDFERANKEKSMSSKNEVKEASAETEESDVDKLEKLGYTTEEYISILRQSQKLKTDRDKVDGVVEGTESDLESSSDSGSDSESDGVDNDLDNKRKDNTPKSVSKPDSSDKPALTMDKSDLSKLQDEKWSVVVLHDYDDDIDDDHDNEFDNVTVDESNKSKVKSLEEKSENQRKAAEDMAANLDEKLEWSEMEIEDFVNIAPPEPDVEDEWQPPVALTRGVTGVFDVEELVIMLKELNGQNIVVISIPPEADYADYMVIVSAKSVRHLNAMAADIKWTYKRKKNDSDKHVRLEGEETDWCAIDMGNIVLHMFMPAVRELYDLETLWTVGPKLDPQCQLENDPYTYSVEELPWLLELEKEKESKMEKKK